MTNYRPRLVTRIVFRLALVISLLIALADASAACQSRNPDQNGNMRRTELDRQQREAMLRKSESEAALAKRRTEFDKRRIEAAIDTVKKDFKQIQIVRNELARNILAGKPLDYNFVLTKAEDVNKRAYRIKTYLMPPTPADKEQAPKSQVEFGGDEMKDALIRLCHLIDSFVENPVLKTPGTTDVEQSVKAGGDLLSIIELSSNIKRSAEKLNKTPR